MPAAALLAGSACGFLFSEPPFVPGCLLLAIGVAGALFAYVFGRSLLLPASIALGFFAGAVLLSSADWQRAWRPSLRVAFEELARRERAVAAVDGRRLPEDDAAFATVEGILRADAALVEAGVSLSVLVDGLAGAPAATLRRGQDRQDGQDGQDRQDGAPAATLRRG